MTDNAVPGVAPIRRTIDLAVEPARAFDVFTRHVRDWWKADVVIEPRVGGRWYERCADGSESEWARVVAYEPPKRLLFNWHAFDGAPTEIEVRFDGPAPRRTNVNVTHRRFENFGDDAER